MPSSQALESLKKDEGFTPRAVHLKLQSGKSERIRTLGYGYNIDAASDPISDLVSSGVTEEDAKKIIAGEMDISKAQAGSLFQISVDRAVGDATRVIPGFNDLDPKLQSVFINMSYQLGAKGLREFKQMKQKLVEKDYDGVAREILNSKFARSQASNRAERLAREVVAFGSNQPKEETAPKPASAKELLRKEHRTQQVSQLSNTISRASLVNKLSDALVKQQKKQQMTTTQTEEE